VALEQFRAWLADRPLADLGPASLTGPDQFPLLESSELKAPHHSLSAYLDRYRTTGSPDLKADAREDATNLALAVIERLIAYQLNNDLELGWHFAQFFYDQCVDQLANFVRFGDTPALRLPVLEWLATERSAYLWSPVLEAVLPTLPQHPLSEEERKLLVLIRCHLDDEQAYDQESDPRKLLDEIMGDGWWNVLAPSEVWAEEAIGELQTLGEAQSFCWREMLLHCQLAKSAKPTGKWLKQALPHLEAVGHTDFRERVTRWFNRVDAARSRKMLTSAYEAVDNQQRIQDRNGDVLRGLLWLCPYVVDADLLRAIRNLALSAYRKIRGLGPRAVKVGNAALLALGEIGSVEAVGQMAILKVRVKFGTAQIGIEKALVKAAEKAGIPREDLEEMAVPSYGLSEVGRRVEEFDGFRCEQVIENSKVELRWFKPDGKPQKSVPKAIKEKYPEDLKELTTASKDIQRMLPAQAARIEDAYRTNKTWPLKTWRERYYDHPLVGTIARRLIWNVAGKPAIHRDGSLEDVNGNKVHDGDDSEVSLWHPLLASTDEVQAWRRVVEDTRIRQPFKQAHRELYKLTDAERNTGTYSNRFAAHVVKQHQFNSLVAARGWKHQLRLMVDAEYAPPHVLLPRWNLRAEFWVEGAGDQYGTDTTESGSYLYLATDQVRFYRLDSAENRAHAGGGGYATYGAEVPANQPLPIEAIPELALSEVLRDVDLFVGVASVGNDPNWSDGGPQGRYREYWSNYSFGELSATATTRKDILTRLIPRLKIADKCQLKDRWLVVRGDRRTYKIHLGSGNILMEPNDQYLCIVAGQSVSGAASKVFLPFEGDNLMAIILSKAFLLADDKKIKDSTILSQINR
jgi:hypothetical protein